MSFSIEVKEELANQLPSARHCCLAELAALIGLCGHLIQTEEGEILRLQTENVVVARKYYVLMKSLFHYVASVSVRRNVYLKKSKVYFVTLIDPEQSRKVLEAVKKEGDASIPVKNRILVNPRIVQSNCCKRAFLRGAFLAAGSMSDPNKFYHLEIVCTTENYANQLKEIMNSFDLGAKVVVRKKYYVVYLKEGNQIVELLGLMEASVSLLNLENVRVLKDMRNSINRQVNCETANLNKTISAAVGQVQDIEYIRDYIGFLNLPETLRTVAEARLENPNATLKELGESLTPPVGKSGVNHRLRKLKEIAENHQQ